MSFGLGFLNKLQVKLEAIRDSHVFFESLREKKSMAVPTPFEIKSKNRLFDAQSASGLFEII